MFSSSAALALCSAVAELLCEMRSICVIAVPICAMPWACSLAAVAIWPTTESVAMTFSEISISERSTSMLHCLPRWVLAMAASIFSAVSRAAAALRWASERTSSATTAKPAPASPARAASTAALSARMLVWKAISSMFFTILPTSAPAVPIEVIASSIEVIVRRPVSATTRASEARPLAFCALSAVARIMLSISSSEALVSSTAAACSLAPADSDWLDIDTCPAADAVCSAPRSRSEVISPSVRRVEPRVSQASRPATSTDRAVAIWKVRVPIFAALAPAMAASWPRWVL